jgi:hypothetical protein
MRKGASVAIRFGPFAGFEATVVSTQRARVVVRIALKEGRIVLLELDKNMIEDAKKDRSTEPQRLGPQKHLSSNTMKLRKTK